MSGQTVTLKCPIRDVGGSNWMSMEFMGIKRLDVVAYRWDEIDSKFTFAGGHRVRRVRFKDNIHLQVPEGTDLDIKDVALVSLPPKRRHNKGR